MRRVLSILVVASLAAANVGAAPVLDHQQPQSKTSTNPKVTSSDKTGRKSASTSARAKAPVKPYQVGDASWYGKQFHGKETASGENFDMFELTAAHRQLPLGTYVKVTNLRNGKWVVVRVNDRGPYVGNRIMDLSYSAARMLNFYGGIEKVRLDVVQPATLASSQTPGAF